MLPATSEPRAKQIDQERGRGEKKKKRKERERMGATGLRDGSRRFFAFGITAACIIRRVYPPRNRCTRNYEPRNPRKARFNVEFRPFSNAPFQDTGLQPCGGTVFHCAPTRLCHFCPVFFPFFSFFLDRCSFGYFFFSFFLDFSAVF